MSTSSIYFLFNAVAWTSLCISSAYQFVFALFFGCGYIFFLGLSPECVVAFVAVSIVLCRVKCHFSSFIWLMCTEVPFLDWVEFNCNCLPTFILCFGEKHKNKHMTATFSDVSVMCLFLPKLSLRMLIPFLMVFALFAPSYIILSKLCF